VPNPVQLPLTAELCKENAYCICLVCILGQSVHEHVTTYISLKLSICFSICLKIEIIYFPPQAESKTYVPVHTQYKIHVYTVNNI